MKKMSNKGDSKYLSIWWFFCLAVVAGGIVISVAILTGSDVSTKEKEAEIMVDRVVDCFSRNGYLREGVLEDDFNIFEECYLNEELIEKDYYLEYRVYNYEDCKVEDGERNCSNEILSKSFGISGFVEQCGLKASGIRAEEYAECYDRYIYLLGREDDEKFVIFVKSGSNQEIKKESSLK